MELVASFFSLENLFNTAPQPLTRRFSVFLLILFGLFIIVAIAIKAYEKSKKPDLLDKKSLNKFFNLFLTMGLMGLIYTFIAYEGVPYLSIKILLVVWAVIAAVWLWSCARFFLKTTPKLKREINERKNLKKYMP